MTGTNHGWRTLWWALPLLVLLPRLLSAQPVLVTPEDLKSRLGSGDGALLILDVRGTQSYQTGTLPHALDTGSDPAGFLPDSKGGKAVLVMNHPPDLEKLGSWQRRLEDRGYQVFVLEGGLRGWQQAGFEISQPEEQYVRPGTVPFIIPRGTCKPDHPVQVFQ